MKVSGANGGGRAVPEVTEFGWRGKRVFGRRIASERRGATNDWVHPWHRADGSRRSLVREPPPVVRSGRYGQRKGRVVLWPNRGGSLAGIVNQKQVEKEGWLRSGVGSGKTLRSYADVVATPLVAESDWGLAGDSSKGVSHFGEAMQGSRKVDAATVPIFSPVDGHHQQSSKVRSVGCKDGKPSVSFSASEIGSGIKKFRNSIVLKFQTLRPSEFELKRFIYCHWKVNGEFHFSEIWDASHVLVRLHSEAAVKKALNCHIRSVGSCRFKGFRWTAGYDPLMQSSLRRFWVILPNLPLFLFDKRFVEVMISGFAKFIRLDKASESCRNLNCMRVRIELDEGKVVPDMIWIHLPNRPGYWQKVQIEGSACPVCCNVHHLDDKCAIVAEGKSSGAGATDGDDISSGGQIDTSKERTVEDTNRWQLVTHSKKKRDGAASKDTVFELGDEGDVSPKNATSICHPKDISDERLVSINGKKRNSVSCIGTHVSFDVGQGALLEVPTPCDIQGQSQGLNTNVKSNSQPRVFVSSIGSQPDTAGPSMDVQADQYGLLHDSRNIGSKKDNNVPSGIRKQTDHVSPNMAHQKSVFQKDVRSTCPSGMSNSVKDSDGQHSTLEPICPSHVSGSDGDGTLVPSEKLEGSSAVPNCHSNVAKEGFKSPHTPSCTVGNHAGSARGRMASPVSQSSVAKEVTQTGPCDSLELVRKNLSRHNSAYEETALEPNEAVELEPKVAQRIAKYGSHIFAYDQGSPINARAYYLGIKALYGDKDSKIFRVMDVIYNSAMQAMEEDPNSPAEESDDSIDISRILKNPRQNSKGTRRSGRSCSKKSDSNFVY